MIKNRTAQLIFQTAYCTLDPVGGVACFGIFDDIHTIRWDFYVQKSSSHLQSGKRTSCSGTVMIKSVDM